MATSQLAIRRRPDGSILVDGLATLVAQLLRELPTLLDEGPRGPARERLFPTPPADEERQEEWRRLVHPDLFALLASSREIVSRDLESLRPPSPPGGGWSLEIPERHLAAWLAGLNAGRLTLAEIHEVDEADMQGIDLSSRDERAQAIRRIHLFGWLQELLIEGAVQFDR